MAEPTRTPIQQACADHLAQLRALPDKARVAVLEASFEHVVNTMQATLLNAQVDAEKGIER